MKYIDLIEIHHIQDLDMIILQLNSHNIDFEVLNENSLRIGGPYVLGYNGAIIRVNENQYERGKELLFDLGLNLDHKSKNDQFDFSKRFKRLFNSIPLFNRLNAGYQMGISLFIVILFLMSLFFWRQLHISTTELVTKSWCVESLKHNGEEIQINTIRAVQIVGLGANCVEQIDFKAGGTVRFPGINSKGTEGHYELINASELRIDLVREHKEIYEGTYDIKSRWDGGVKLISENSEIILTY